MGYMTFGQMGDEVSQNLGGETLDQHRLNLWLNWAIQDLASYVKVVEQKKSIPFEIVEGTSSYSIPEIISGGDPEVDAEDVLGIITVSIPGFKLRKMHREFERAEDEIDLPAGAPKYWMRRGSSIIIWPNPDNDYTGSIEYAFIPLALADPAAKTILPASFDMAIVRMATHYGFLALGKDNQAEQWLSRAITYINSRLTDVDFSKDAPKDGLNVAWDHRDLSRNPRHI